MYIVFVVVAAVVVFAVAAAAVGRGDGLEKPFPDLERPYLPDSKIEPADVDDVHFAVGLRGYRMDQVDSVLDRLAEELVNRDQHIARLERIVQTQTMQASQGYTPRANRAGTATAAPPPPTTSQRTTSGDTSQRTTTGDEATNHEQPGSPGGAAG